MSELIDQETQSYTNDMIKALSIARELTERTRIQSMDGPIPRDFPIFTYFDGNLFWESYYLQPDYFLALFYDDTKAKSPDPYTERGLEDCQAWIFKYDRQHSRLSIETWNAEIGNRSFSQIAHRLATE
ncbi:unnamed protein product [marine sediment metagenome]|uniref:Uncharacterized protein n=1 Tax=marine sediment metagenome TaxID=412755 RepID=X1SN42_9ZZZZ